ncbi:MAG: polyprenyl synthetase family protein [Candidatus Moranbacteria bacterium]|nr:polyprenyl synthetase family protein [Candidatus Moranbacteria bacterium]
MEIKEYLQEYKKRVDGELEKYFELKTKQAAGLHPLAEEAVGMIKDITMSGGKRIRPAIIYYSYLANGGKDNEEIVKTSMSIELAHIFLLIHDDIIDKDDFRHNVPTVHRRYEEKALRVMSPQKVREDAKHFGTSMAIIVGDMASSMTQEIIFNSSFPPDTIVKALNAMQEIVYRTLPGEMMDVEMELRGRADEEEILKMHEGKTAHYTFEGPIHMGWVLAGEISKENMDNFSKYALSVGKAFQIRDDILGVFGREDKLGKPVGSDIIEGKQTLLILKARERGSGSQQKIIDELLGKRNLLSGELEAMRRIIRETGSLEYSQKLAEKLVKEGLNFLHKVDFKNVEARDFFEKIADYIIKRNF